MKVKRTREIDPDAGQPGSIEQQLDMNESGPYRGEEILRNKGRTEALTDDIEIDHASLPDEDGLQHNYRVDMSEPNREGDEMSGDEHSAGLQGGDPDLDNQPTIDTGLPGEETDKDEARANNQNAA